MPRTPTLPPTEPAMWRKLLAKVHPDAGGDHELFIWARNVQERVCGRQEEEESPPPPQDSGPPRVPFEWTGSFEELTNRALDATVEAIYSRLLWLLEDCEEVDDGPLYTQQTQGATYKTLAAIGHAAGMGSAQRTRWYRLAEGIPLSQRHAGHILSKLKQDA